MNIKTVLIFGVFDGIHDGHRNFIDQAIKYGTKLVAVVARDIEVSKLKNKTPTFDEVNRIKNLVEVTGIDQVFLGDLEQGTYNVLKEILPDVIFLGYDQQSLFNDINLNIKNGNLPKIEIVYGKSYKPEQYHSSILNDK